MYDLTIAIKDLCAGSTLHFALHGGTYSLIAVETCRNHFSRDSVGKGSVRNGYCSATLTGLISGSPITARISDGTEEQEEGNGVSRL